LITQDEIRAAAEKEYPQKVLYLGDKTFQRRQAFMAGANFAISKQQAECEELRADNDIKFHLIMKHGEEIQQLRFENEKMRIVCDQLERWRNAWASQETQDAEPARKAMLKALDYVINKPTEGDA
jgi:hypothetical protein